jgi:predicted O-methyltransferase YrrM
VTSTDLKIDRALTIDGWMSFAELSWLAFVASQHQRIVELGSHLGRSTRALADNTNGIVYAVDDFMGPRDIGRRQRRRMAAGQRMYDSSILQQFKANMEGVFDRVVVVQQDHESVNPLDLLPPFDMIFIDGAHDYASVYRDINKWLPFITSGGLVSGHDFSEGYPGVRQAVQDTFGHQFNVVPDTSIWTVRV